MDLYYSRHACTTFAAAFICAIAAVQTLTHVPRQTFTGVPLRFAALGLRQLEC